MSEKQPAIDDERTRQLFRALDGLRGQVPIDEYPQGLVSAGWSLTWEDLFRLSVRRGSDLGRPPHLTRFLSALGRELSIESAVDPFVTAPGILGSLAGANRRLLGYAVSRETVDVARLVVGDNLEWRRGRLDLDPSPPEQFGWLVSSPPVGMNLDPGVLVPSDLDPRAARREAGLIAVAKTLPQIEHGLVLLLSESFLWADAGALWREYFASHGFELDAALSVADGLAPATSIPTVLCLFTRVRRETIFVGRVTPATDGNGLAAALTARKSSKRPELGSLVQRDEFQGWDSFLARLQLERLLKRRGVEMVPIGRLALEIRTGESRPDEEAEPAANSIYFDSRVVRAVGTSPPVPRPGARYGIRYVEVALDPARADAEFVARWLNSDDGKVTIDTVAVGVAQKRVPKDAISGLLVPAPTLAEQTQGLKLSTRLSGLRQEILNLEARLWKEPWTARTIEDDLAELVEDDPLLAWINRLPFPLAAIVMRYKSDVDDEAKIRRLLQFFEAFAELAYITLLSALKRDPERWEAEKVRVRAPEIASRHPLVDGQFGGWIHHGSHLAKAFRTDLSGQTTEDERRRMFGVGSAHFAEALTAKSLWATFDEARLIRNARAHGGDWGQAESRLRLERLERLLAAIRDQTNRAYSRVELIQPGSGRRQHEGRTYDHARRLMGPLSTFVPAQLVTQAHVDLVDDSLCFVDQADTVEDALELIPLVRLMPSPETEQNAAFFFNKQEGENFKFVSYAYQGESETPLADPRLAAVVGDLLG